MKNILIIEDQDHFCELYKHDKILKEHNVFFAEDVKTAIEKIKEKIWDIIVLDGCLNDAGKLNTLELIPVIKKLCPNVPIIANSSSYNDELISAGCDHTSCPKNFLSRRILQLVEGPDSSPAK